MSGAYNSSHELAAKMDNEGGLAEFIFGYGISTSDLPGDMPEEIKYKLLELLQMSEVYSEVQQWLYDRFDDDPVPGDYDYEEPE